MAGHEKDEPGHFAKLVAAAIRDEMSQRGLSGRALGRILNMSEKYARERVNDRFEFTLNDVENFALHIGEDPEEFIGRIERSALDAEVPTTSTHLQLVDVSADEEDESEDYIFITSERRRADKLAAHRGPRKADEPSAD